MQMPDLEETDPAGFWDRVFTQIGPIEDPRPNVRLAEAVVDQPPGEALELGCGGGGDALWLAGQGWRVTSADISQVAITRLGSLAAKAGLADRLKAVHQDLSQAVPEGSYDLVSACYFHTPYVMDRSKVLRTAASRLRSGGLLLIVDHGSVPPWSWNQDRSHPIRTPQDVAADLALDPYSWTIVSADQPSRMADGPEGQRAEVADNVLIIRRD